MQKKVKKIKQKGKKDEKNKLIIDRKTLDVNSSNPPEDIGHGALHEVESTDDIIVTDEHFKTADKLGPCHELEFENGKLRSKLVLWSDYLQLDGKLYKLQVDPLARKIKVIDT